MSDKKNKKPVILVDGCVYINVSVFRKIVERNCALRPQDITYLCDKAIVRAYEQNKEDEGVQNEQEEVQA